MNNVAAGTAGEPILAAISDLVRTRMRQAAGHLRIPARLAGGPADAQKLAADVGADPATLPRLLRGLVAIGLLEQTGPQRFGPGPDPDKYAEAGDAPEQAGGGPPEQAGADPMAAAFSLDGFLYSIRTGRPAFRHNAGVGTFAYLEATPAASSRLHAATADATTRQAPALLAEWDLSGYRHVVDVGGGSGALIAAILTADPDILGTVFDRRDGAEAAAKRLAARPELDGRWHVMAGDFFERVPEAADAYVLKSVLHDWDDEGCARILRNCRDAMAGGGRVFIVERVVPPIIERSADHLETVLSDMVCLLLSDGGRERTEQEFAEVLAAAGYAQIRRITPAGTHFSVIEATPE